MLTCISYSFCSGNGGAAVVEYWQRYPHCRIVHLKTFETIHIILREIGSFPQANAEHEQQQCGEGDVLAAVCEAKVQVYAKFLGQLL
jgi:hypothetical protein